LHSHFLVFFEPFMPFKHTYSWSTFFYAFFDMLNVSVAVFSNFTQNLMTGCCSILKTSTWQKTTFTKTVVILLCINQASWNLHII
jgi:hypothetical protein